MQSREFEREALHRLPELLSELFGEEQEVLEFRAAEPDDRIDAQFEFGHRTWLIEIKSSSSPGVIDQAADQLSRRAREEARLLVVPFMSAGGARAAAERELNWIDLSGNASVRDERLRLLVQGLPNRYASAGRPASAFAAKSSRVARSMLLDPNRWWRQKELAEQTDLDPSRVSRVVQALDRSALLTREAGRLRPRDPGLLLDAWADDYRLDRHDIVAGHLSGSGPELVRELDRRLSSEWTGHAATGLAAAWLIDQFARFRIVSVYVEGDPRAACDAAGIRVGARGANVQIIGPDDRGVFAGAAVHEGIRCVSAPQVLLDLAHQPERADEAAQHLRHSLGWRR